MRGHPRKKKENDHKLNPKSKRVEIIVTTNLPNPEEIVETSLTPNIQPVKLKCSCCPKEDLPLSSKDEIMGKTDEELITMVSSNWRAWIKGRDQYKQGIAPDDQIPPILKYRQQLPLIQANRKEFGSGDELDVVNSVLMNTGDRASCRGIQCVDYSIPTINFLTAGLRYWVIVKKNCNHKLEKLFSSLTFRIQKTGCVFGTGEVLVPDVLKVAQIEYVVEIQREQKAIIMFEGAYYSWINLVDGTTCFVSPLATLDWFDYAVKQEKFKCKCRETYKLDLKAMQEGYNIAKERAKCFQLNSNNGSGDATFLSILDAQPQKRSATDNHEEIENENNNKIDIPYIIDDGDTTDEDGERCCCLA